MPNSTDYLSTKQLVPSELRSREWNTVSAWLRERSFFMASVVEGNLLSEFRNVSSAVASGQMSAAEARQHMRDWLNSVNYSPTPGLEHSIKDLRSTARLRATIDTNVAMAHGWAQRQENLRDTLHPAQELFRAAPAAAPRDWNARWRAAAEQVNYAGVAPHGQHIALTTSPIWRALSAFNLPYPPFDWGSHMRLRLVPREYCIQIGLLIDPNNDPASPSESLNDGIEADISAWTGDIRQAIADSLQGLATLNGNILRMTDPNGTSTYSPHKLASIITAPLPQNIPNLQADAARAWLQNRQELQNSTTDQKEDMARLIQRCSPSTNLREISRGIPFDTPDQYHHFLSSLQTSHSYSPRPNTIAEAWSDNRALADAYASTSPHQVLLICQNPKNARDLRPIYKAVIPGFSPRTLGNELLLPSGTHLRILSISTSGNRTTITCQEQD